MLCKEVGKGLTPMLGIDVSKNKLDYCLIDQKKEPVLWGEVANTPEGIADLLSKIPSDTPIVLESTGRYSLEFVMLARGAGHRVFQALTIDAKSVLRGLNRRAKTDKIDGRGLAIYGVSAEKIRLYPVKDKDVDELDQLLSVRRSLSGSISRFNLQRQSLELAGSTIDGIIATLKTQLKALDKQISEMLKQNKRFEAASRLLEIPGIGPITAASVCSRLEAKRFDHPDQFVAYVGLALKINDSGKRTGHRFLDKNGDAELRRLLYLAAQSNLRVKDSPFKAQYQKHRDKGLASTQALCAVARKLATICWSMHKHGTSYTPERVGTRPTQQKDDICAKEVAS